MKDEAAHQPRGGKLIAMWTALAAIPIFVMVVLILAFYALGKLTFSEYVCGSFAQLDAEIGWVLAPSVTSCLGGRNWFSPGQTWFESSVYIDVNGFRSASAATQTPAGGVMMLGDSFTFGYGVNFEESFPGAFESLSGIRVVDVASPAYSSAQALLLAERWIGRLQPRAIVFLEAGQWARAACRGQDRPSAILKPCYWQSPSGDVEVVLPPPGRVQRWGAAGVVPGGMVGAGEITWTYFLWSRPTLLAVNWSARLGLISGFAHDFAAIGVDEEAIRRGVAHHIGRLVEQAKVPVIVLDPFDYIPPAMIDALPSSVRPLVHRVGKSQWDAEVAAPVPPGERTLPHDGHFSAITNRLVAELILRECQKLRCSSGR
jgi:hypothetical protein